MSDVVQTDIATSLQTAVHDILGVIDQDREREIITRRFGLTDRRETLEQIGELLGITRERVRQLEKAILIRLKIAAEDDKVPAIHDIERMIVRDLSENGRVARISDITDRMIGNGTDNGSLSRAHVAFIAELAPKLVVVSENDNYHHAVGISEYGDEKAIKARVDDIVKTIKKHGQPLSIEQLHEQLSYENPAQVRALASISKLLAHLKDNWGLAKWPTVNPKNIRDKIYVILSDNGKSAFTAK